MKRQYRNYHKAITIGMIAFLAIPPIMSLVMKDRAYSAREKRVLQGVPTLTATTVLDGTFMDEIEDYLADQFPGRDQMVQAKSGLDQAIGSVESQGVYLGKDNTLMERFTMPSDETINSLTGQMNTFATRYEKSNFYLMIVPTAISIYPERLQKHAVTDDQNAYIETMYKKADAYTPIRLKDAFTASKSDTELYYHTDHHWTSEGAYIAYTQLQQVMGLTSKVAYQPKTVSNCFSGSLAAKSGFLLGYRDHIEIMMPSAEDEVLYTVAYPDHTAATGYMASKLSSDDPYQVFFGGNYAKLTIETTADTNKTLLVVKDSYANCFVPFLYEDYKKIVMIDPRYYYEDIDLEMQVGNFTDVLFLYNANTLSEDRMLLHVLENEQ